MIRLFLTFAFTTLCLQAQVELVRQWTPPAGEARLSPKTECSSLRSLTGYELSVISAVPQPAEGDRPAFCRVLAQVQPEIRFEVALPDSWNKRLLMIGNGGYAGENLELPARVATRDEAMRKGLAFTHTNTGHDAEAEPLGSFAVNSQKLLDYAFRAVHVTAESAKKLAAAYYGSAPSKSYFAGCSTGGRQALISAQRFPQDFDGILAGAPVLDFVSTMLNYAAIVKAFEAAPVSLAKMKLAGEVAYAQCDALDGVKDGIIEDPRRCAFDPAVHLTKCSAGDAASCFTEAQIQSLRILYSDQKISGRRVFPRWPVGAEATGANGRIGWEPWLVREGAPSVQTTFGETFFRYLAFPRKDPNLRLSQLELERDSGRLDFIRQVLNATDADLSGYRGRGGKLLMYFGWADPALNPNMGVEYYESVLAKMGPSTKDFFRLLMMPGVFHCGGGPGCDSAPFFSRLVEWTEGGKAPDVITASKIRNGSAARTRPLCVYPQVARYKGSGNVDEAASFVCADAAR